MAPGATPDRDELLAFELALDERVCDEVREEAWGRLFLTPSLPLIWDASWVALERAGLGLDEVVAIADEALGGAGFTHRTVALLGEAEGRRLAAELESGPGHWPGWEVERDRYMVWRPNSVTDPTHPPSGVRSNPRHAGITANSPVGGVREVCLEEIEGLRRALIAEEMPPAVDELEATVEQLHELSGRYASAGGDRWFAAPASGEPLSCCRLLRDGNGVAQVEDVGTREGARDRGYAKAIVGAAIGGARAAGDEAIFLTADAADWPQLLYGRLGFETVGEIAILRRRP